jgi:outer membrane usher protein
MRGWLKSGVAAFVAIQILAPVPTASAAKYADEVKSGRINQTKRAISMSVPLDDGGRALGEVMLRIETNDTVYVSKASLMQRMGAELRPNVMTAIEKLPDMVTLDQLAKAGLDLSFDYRGLVMHTVLAADQRQDGEISLASKPLRGSSVISKQAPVSGYANFYADAAHLWGADETALRFSNESVVKFMDVVLESEFSLENNINGNLCPANGLCTADHQGGVKRQGSRVVYDIPGWQDRFTLGDTHSAQVDFGRSADVLGVTFEHSPLKLAPGEPIRATGSSTFRLERPSTVEIVINGASVQRRQLPAGNYNLRDLPLRSGANDVVLRITDDLGISRTLQFNQFSGSTLLAKGKSEWAVSGGIPSYFRDGEIDYRDNEYLASVFGRYGVETNLTLEASYQSDRRVQLGGGGATWSTPFGIWGLYGSASSSDSGVGGSGRLTWEIQGKDNADSLRLSAEVHTPEFRTPGDFDLPLGGIILPTYQFKDSFSGSYSLQLAQQWQLTLSGRYDVADPKYYEAVPLAVRGDRYHADLSLSHPIFEDATLTGTVGYSNEIYNRSFTSASLTDRINNTDGELWAGLRLYWRPTSKTTITADTDTLNQRSTVNGSYVTNVNGVDAWSANVAVTDDRPRSSTSLNTGISYTGQRTEVSLSHDTGLTTFAPNGTSFAFDQQRTTARVGSALVFADGHSAISAPIRGDGGFAILYPHESIEGHEITAGPKEYRLAHSDPFGPAVIRNLSPYSDQTIPIDVADLPVGYSLGAGGFDLKPSYRSGYALQVGSGYSVTAFGVMIDRDGKPLSLSSGTASDGSKTVNVFTNQAGKFSADGLAPGSWKFSMAGEGSQVDYVITIPKGTEGLYKAGEIRP